MVQSGQGIDRSKAGLLSRPYQTLHNMRVVEGNWRKRPGQEQLITSIPGTAATGNAKVIAEIVHPTLSTIVAPDSESENPNADGAVESGWTYSTGTDVFDLIDDDTGVTYVQFDATNASVGRHSAFTVTFPDLSTTFNTINRVDVNFKWFGLGDYDTSGSNPVPSPTAIFLLYRAGGVTYLSNVATSIYQNQNPWVNGESYTGNSRMHVAADAIAAEYISIRDRTYSFGTDPATGLGWTATSVNAAEWGVVAYVASGGGQAFRYSGGRIYDMNMTVHGISSTSPTNRPRSKIFVSGTDWLRAAEDLSAFEDIDTAGDAPITAAQANAVWDWTEFNAKLWFTNGEDEIAYFPQNLASDHTMTDLAGDPRCRVLGTYASRLFLGDTEESSVRTPQRVIWSAINDGTDYTTASSGTIDLDETPGAVMAFHPFTEARDQTFIGVLVVFKTDSIFHLEATGIPSDPFDKRVMASTVGLAARHTVVPYTRNDGEAVLAFLGYDGGYLNVYEWNGDQAVPIGDAIAEELQTLCPPDYMARCWAYHDPVTHHYVLGVPNGAEWPNFAYVYDITNDLWTTESFEEAQCVGTWNFFGEPHVILGRNDSLPYRVDVETRTDEFTDDDTDGIMAVWETGLFRLAEEPNRRSCLYRVWVYYRPVTSGATYTVQVSTNGNNYADYTPQSFTAASSNAREVEIKKLDFLVEGHLHQLRIESSVAGEDIEIEKVVLEYEEMDTFV